LKKPVIFITIIFLNLLTFESIAQAKEITSDEIDIPDYVKRGDIIFMDTQDYTTSYAIPGYSNDHAAIYLGHDYENGRYFINALGKGVSYITIDEFSNFLENFTYYRVKDSNKTIIEKTISWAESKLGYKYQCFFPNIFFPKLWYVGMFELGKKCADTEDKTVKTAKRFYCTELVWASYYNQGIDIDQNGWEKIKPEIPSDNVPYWQQLIWNKVGWAFEYVDCEDIKTSEKVEQLLPE